VRHFFCLRNFKQGGRLVNVKRIFLLGTAALLLFQNQVNAYTEKEMTEYTNGFVKENQANI